MKVTILVSISYSAIKFETVPAVEMFTFDEMQEGGYFDNEFRHQYGNLFEFTQGKKCLWVVREVEMPIDTPNVYDFIQEQMGLIRIELMTYFNFLWIKKDNSISVYYQYAYIRGMKESYMYNSDRPDFFANGQLDYIAFSQEEINDVKKWYAEYLARNKNHQVSNEMIKELMKKGEDVAPGAIAGLINYTHYDDYTRLERAIMFMGAARGEEFMMHRIAIYMQVLEALFATENEAMNFKIPFRAANYLTQDTDEKWEVFSAIKGAYNIRSRYFHGDELNKGTRPNQRLSMDDLRQISVNIDHLIRLIFKKIFSSNDIDTFLLNAEDEIKDIKGKKEVVKEGFKSYLDKLTFGS